MPQLDKVSVDTTMALANTAMEARRAGLSTEVIIYAAFGQNLAALAIQLGRHEVAEALRSLALRIDQPTGGRQ